jgi:uncharacterized protein (TIGR02594 family)
VAVDPIPKIETSPLEIARAFDGQKEIPGNVHNPMILSWIQLDAPWYQTDETPWCSSFVNYPFFVLGLNRSASPAARSWLDVGVRVDKPWPGFDIVVLKQSISDPGREVREYRGHVGFYDGLDLSGGGIWIFSGNQGNKVCRALYPWNRVLDIRRIL